MKSSIQFLIAVILVFFFSWLSQYEFNELRSQESVLIRQQNKDIIDDDNDGQHDSTCMCGYCEEGYIDSLSLK